MPAALIEAFERDFGIHVIHAWGMTETAPIGSIAKLTSAMSDLPSQEQLRLRSKQGMPPAGIEMRIRDEAGRELPWDGTSVGEVEVRGPWVASRYFENPEGDVSFTEDGWFRTGDVGTMDAHGFMQITDRAKDLIKSGGEWISSVDLENAIMGHPDVVECAVIAMPHEKWLERPLAIAVAAPDAEPLTLDEIHAFLQDRVAKWWLPDAVTWVEALPKTSVGKFDKKVMRAQYAEEAPASGGAMAS